MARDRSTTDEAYPGDIIGIPNHGSIRLGETFTEGEELRFVGIPSFAPEHFRLARIANPLRIKQLHRGLQQLAEEGRPNFSGRLRAMNSSWAPLACCSLTSSPIAWKTNTASK